jgi:hypothetical protein
MATHLVNCRPAALWGHAGHPPTTAWPRVAARGWPAASPWPSSAPGSPDGVGGGRRETSAVDSTRWVVLRHQLAFIRAYATLATLSSRCGCDERQDSAEPCRLDMFVWSVRRRHAVDKNRNARRVGGGKCVAVAARLCRSAIAHKLRKSSNGGIVRGPCCWAGCAVRPPAARRNQERKTSPKIPVNSDYSFPHRRPTQAAYERCTTYPAATHVPHAATASTAAAQPID